MKIGFIGLGIMGSRMAANLQNQGHDLVVHNRTRKKADSLVANGASWADNPAEVAKQVEILFTMLSNPEAVYETASGKDGFLGGLKENALWVDCSTVNPSFSKEMMKKASERNIRFVDAPVAGTKGPAADGQLLFFAGGDAEDVEACQPFFNVMGRNVIHVGAHGMGSAMKMVFNLLLGEAMLAFSEAMVLGQSVGISQEMLFNVLLKAPVVAPFLAGKKAKMESGEYEAEFPLQWMRKDLHLASLTAYEQGIALPSVNVAKEVFSFAARFGLAEKDFSAVYQFLSEKGDR